MRPHRRGFSLMELVVVMAVMGIMAAIVAPRLRVSPQQRVRAAAVQLGQDLDLVRTRGLAARRATRVVFDVANNRYDGYMAAPGVTTFAESAAEQDSLGALRRRVLPDNVIFGRGETPDVPGYAGGGEVTLPDDHADFNSRGLSEPFGTSGVVYITDLQDPTAVGAVVVTAGAAMRVLTYDGENWR